MVMVDSAVLSSPSTVTVNVTVSALSATIVDLSAVSTTVGPAGFVAKTLTSLDFTPLLTATKRYSPAAVVLNVDAESTELSLRQIICTPSLVTTPFTVASNKTVSTPSAIISLLFAESVTVLVSGVSGVVSSHAVKPTASEKRAIRLNSFFIICLVLDYCALSNISGVTRTANCVAVFSSLITSKKNT